jgi:uncharacterized membrane protein YedE/YeeE
LREYQIPRNVSAKFEFWPGFGWVELLITTVGILIGLAFRYLVLFIARSQWGLLFVAFFGAAGYFLVKPMMSGGDSFLTAFQRYKKYMTRQKLYLYQKKVK